MVVVIEIVGWLMFVVALVGILLNFVLVRRDPDHRHHPATRRLVLIGLIGGGALLAVAYTLRQLDVGDTLIDSGRRGGSLWVMVVVFVVLAVSAARALRKGEPPQAQ